MPRKKVEENHVITEPGSAEKTFEPDDTEKTEVFVKLTGGGSFTTGDYFFRKDEPVPAPEKLAEKLIKTGFFVRA